MEIAHKILALRVQAKLKQEEVAKALGFSRPTYVLIERGDKALTVPELQSLASFYGLSLAEFLFGSADLGSGQPDLYKMFDVVLGCLYYGANEWGVMTKFKLSKLVVLADYEWYRQHKISMYGRMYARTWTGVEPDRFTEVVEALYNKATLRIDYQNGNVIVSATQEPSLEHLTKVQQKHIKRVGAAWKDKSSYDTSGHVERMAQAGRYGAGSVIPYEMFAVVH